jgi:hypothetical protein
MGEIPATARMVSTVIINPKNLDTIPEKTTFDIQVNIANMALGSFTNATSTYYTAPQKLDGQGRIIGHTHVTVQDTGASLNPTQPLDGEKFAFFKGINDAGNGNGLLSTTVTGGLPAGNYRVCSMAGASNHQPVLMAVAQRGAQDDCKYFTVTAAGAGGGNGGANGGGNNGGNTGGAGGTNNAATGGDKGGTGTGAGGAASSVASSSAAAASTSAAAAGGNGGGNGGGGRGGFGGGFGGGRGGKGNGAGAGAGNAASSAVSSSAAAAATTSAVAAGGNGGKGAAAATSSAAAAATTSAAANAGKGGKGAAGTNNAAAGADGAAIAGIAAPAVQNVGGARPFSVNGDTFVNESAAKQRACAIQNNKCADAVNSGKAAGKTVTDCNAQETACNAA